MIAAKIQSIVMVVGFVAFLAVAGLSIGLMAVSTFSSHADATTAYSVRASIGEYHCHHSDCDFRE
jgi:hypothetical protein